MRKSAPILLLISLIFCICSLQAQQSSKAPFDKAQSQAEPSTTLKVDVNLVNVFVTVTDAQGSPIGGL
jgi:uncharacterized protein YpmB